MKANFTFELPEETQLYEMYRKAPDMHGALHQLAQDIRTKVKYEDLAECDRMTWDNIRDWFWQVMQDHDIDPMG